MNTTNVINGMTRIEHAAWLKSLVESVRLGGVWFAPMGFIFRKTGERELTLVSANIEDKSVAETVKLTAELCELAGIKCILDSPSATA
jgi:hypothetical protein